MFRLGIALAIALLGALALAQTRRYNVGREATPDEIRARDISVSPGGSGLPPGRGTPKEGRLVYQTKCSSCHGDRGQGSQHYPALAGGRGTLATDKPLLTVGSYWPHSTTVWDYIHRTMPYQEPGTLTADETYCVTAYILYLNEIIRQDKEMNEKTLPTVRMPNRDVFVPDARPDVKSKSKKR